jgi:hypothetical protein
VRSGLPVPDEAATARRAFFLSSNRRGPKLGNEKRWRLRPTIGNGLKNASSGRARLQTTACANNMPAWVKFGLSVLRGRSFSPA